MFDELVTDPETCDAHIGNAAVGKHLEDGGADPAG